MGLLKFWSYCTVSVVNGQIKRLQYDDIQSNVLEIEGSNIQSAYITCPADPAATLGIKLPFLVMIVKNLKKYFTFEIQILDDKNVRRRFRASNYQVCNHCNCKVKLLEITMGMIIFVLKLDNSCSLLVVSVGFCRIWQNLS